MGEAVTLAHVTRPLVLAQALDDARHEVHFAVDDRLRKLVETSPFTLHRIHSVAPAWVDRAMARGVPLYNRRILEGYVEEDLALLDRLRPDLVVGDFRLSLGISAVVRKIPYANIINAHWSPYVLDRRYPFPEHWSHKVFGVHLAQAVFEVIQPLVLAFHSAPFNGLRRKYGLPPLGDMRRVYTQGDYNLYADTPELVPTRGLPDSHFYLGPVLWSPESARPEWWDALPSDRPAVYVTLGSSGQVRVIPELAKALGRLPVSVMLATAGRPMPPDLPDNFFTAAYLPGTEAAARAALVICSGGSATAYQALAGGVPVIGIPSNLDQYITMHHLARRGAGLLLRAETLSAEGLAGAVSAMLAADNPFRATARSIAGEFSRYDAPRRFSAFVERLLPA